MANALLEIMKNLIQTLLKIGKKKTLYTLILQTKEYNMSDLMSHT